MRDNISAIVLKIVKSFHDGSKAKPVVEVFEVEIGAETPENAASAFPAPSEAPVVAKLSYFPLERSSLAKINVQVSDVSEYRWKLVPNPELCVDGLNFSDWVGTSQTLVADQSSFPDNQAIAILFLSVFQRKSSPAGLGLTRVLLSGRHFLA